MIQPPHLFFPPQRFYVHAWIPLRQLGSRGQVKAEVSMRRKDGTGVATQVSPLSKVPTRWSVFSPRPIKFPSPSHGAAFKNDRT